MNNGINGPSKTRGNTVDLGIVGGMISINYAQYSQFQNLTLNGTAVTFVKGAGWPSSSNTVTDLTLNIIVTSVTSVTWTIVNYWHTQPDAPLPVGSHIFLLRSVGGIVQGHYIGNKTNDVQTNSIAPGTAIGNVTAGTGAFTTLSSSGATTMTVNTASTSTNTGTLVVTGGVGVSGNITVGGGVSTNNLDIAARYTEKVNNISISTNTLTVNLLNGNLFTCGLNANITTLTISNAPATSGVAIGFSLALTADGTLRTVTWPASVKWAGGTAPTLTSTNGKIDVLSFLTTNNGTNWFGFVGGQNY